jgi:hypothetical protein
MDTNLFWNLRGNYTERLEKLSKMSREYLEAAILDSCYNNFIWNIEEENNITGQKRIPYIGWYWRHVTFSDFTNIRIGDCGQFVGFMERNKWNYPERYLTEDEGHNIIAFLDKAMRIQEGASSETTLDIVLQNLWDYMQTLKIER